MITVLSGGTGSAKLVRGLAAITDDLTVICNVGDNVWLHGLYICPDIDTIVYALSGLLDRKHGWGIRGDTFNFLGQLRRHHVPSWFSLGDKDLATHVLRTHMLKQGFTLSESTEKQRKQLGVDLRIVPATDDQVTTTVVTDKGKMHLQEFWVKHKGMPDVRRITFEGAKAATPCKAAIDAIRAADSVVIAPGNPVSSIGPTLAVIGFRQELTKKRDRVIAISPVIGETAVSGPALKYMKALGLEISPVGVARYLAGAAGNFVISKSDHLIAGRIRELDMKVFETDIIMKNKQGEIRLARYVIDRMGKS